jgi:hypothetical protein
VRTHLSKGIGDRVCFQAGEHSAIEGMPTRYNKKTVMVIADDGRQWNVSPGLLGRATSRGSARADTSNMIRLK